MFCARKTSKDFTRLYVTDVIFDENIQPTTLDGNYVLDDHVFGVMALEEPAESEYVPTDVSGSTDAATVQASSYYKYI